MSTTEGTRRRWLLGSVLAALLTVGWTTAALLDGGGDLHDLPVVLVGPDVVTSALIAESGSLPGDPLTAGSTDDVAQAEDLLRDGRAAAVLRIDLRGTEDRLVLAEGGSTHRDRALVDLVTSIEDTHGRTVTVLDTDGTPAVPTLLAAGLAVGAGFALAVLASVWRGAVALSSAAVVRRSGAVTALAVLVGTTTAAVSLLTGGSAGWAGCLALAGAAAAAATLTFACEAVAGLPGTVGAAVLLLGLPLPLLVAGDPALLDQPWRAVVAWTVVGAASSALTAAAGAVPTLLPWVTLVTAIGVSLIVLRRRRRATAGAATGPGPATDLPAPGRVRRQLVGIAAGCLALVVATYSVAAIGIDRTPPVAGASLASTTTCRPTGPVTSIADLNAITRLRGSSRMRGGDVGASAALQDGRAVWLFGDTIRDADVEGGAFVRNSMLVVGPDCLQVVVPESGGAVMPDRADGVGYWPMSVVVSQQPGYDLLTVTAQRVRTVDRSNVFGFDILGASLVTFVVPVGGVPQFVSTTDLGADDPDTTKPMWGAATATDGRWLYLDATSRPPDAVPGTGFSVRVARARPDRITRPATWRYWDGSGWSADEDAAATLITADNGVSQTFSVLQHDDRWLVFSKQGEVFGQDLVFWTADAPTGPFAAQPPVAPLPSDATSGVLRYLPLAHPELLPAEDSMIVSYSQNTTAAGVVLDDPLQYRIHFLRVPLP